MPGNGPSRHRNERRRDDRPALPSHAGLVHGACGGLPGTAEAEDHAGEDGEGPEESKRCDGAGAGQRDGGQ